MAASTIHNMTTAYRKKISLNDWGTINTAIVQQTFADPYIASKKLHRENFSDCLANHKINNDGHGILKKFYGINFHR